MRNTIARFESHTDDDEALDDMYTTVDAMMRAGHFEDVIALVEAAPKSKLNLLRLLALLSLTRPYAERIDVAREAVAKVVREQDPDGATELLRGLRVCVAPFQVRDPESVSRVAAEMLVEKEADRDRWRAAALRRWPVCSVCIDEGDAKLATHEDVSTRSYCDEDDETARVYCDEHAAEERRRKRPAWKTLLEMTDASLIRAVSGGDAGKIGRGQ